jgi:cation/acetate symporter
MNPLQLFSAAVEKYGDRVLQPGTKIAGSGWDAISLGVELMFGTAALPHVLMRAFTAPDVKAARMSILYATGIIGSFHLLVFVIGFGAMVLVGPEVVTKAGGGGNMAAPLLAPTVGGSWFFGFICAVAFATMLAVVAGLTLSGVAMVCHDLWVNVVRQGHSSEREQLTVARIATVAIAALAMFLGVAFEGQNVAFMAGLAFAVAASANFPALLLSTAWKRFTTAAAVVRTLVGTFSALVMVWLSPTVQVDVLGKYLADVSRA